MGGYRNRPTLLGYHQAIARLRELLVANLSITARKKGFRSKQPLGRRFDEGKRAENERAIAAEIDKMRMEEAIASNDPEVTRYFSDLLGKGELSVDLTSRAAQYAQAAPDMGPMGALKLAAAEFGAGGTTEREYQRNVSQLIGQEMADKVADMGEIRPELALINQIESEKRGRGTTDAGVADVSVSEDRLLAALAKTDLERMKPAEQAALLFALDERGQAAYRAAQQQPAPYRETTPEENRDINAASGLNRTKGLGKGGRNAFNREAGVSGRYANTNITEPYKVPILVAPAVEEKKLGKAQNFRVDVDSKGNVIYQPARVKTGQRPGKVLMRNAMTLLACRWRSSIPRCCCRMSWGIRSSLNPMLSTVSGHLSSSMFQLQKCSPTTVPNEVGKWRSMGMHASRTRQQPRSAAR